MLKIIGNTPLVKIRYKYKQKINYIYAKLESYNLTGSIKDRVAYYIITKAKERGDLKEEMPIIEATSGNTGISLAALGKYYKHPVHIFMPDWVSNERIQIIKGYGAQVTTFSHEQGGFKRCVKEAKNLAKKINGFYANQFANQDNLLAQYETTGQEILNVLQEDIGGFVSGVGTGDTLMGIGKKLRRQYQDIKVVAIEPDTMPLISGHKIIGPHKIEGIGDDFLPDLIDKNGVGVGISSGANFLGCALLQDEIKTPVVTVFADDNKKYLSTDLGKPIEPNKKYISNQIELLDYEVC